MVDWLSEIEEFHHEGVRILLETRRTGKDYHTWYVSFSCRVKSYGEQMCFLPARYLVEEIATEKAKQWLLEAINDIEQNRLRR